MDLFSTMDEEYLHMRVSRALDASCFDLVKLHITITIIFQLILNYLSANFLLYYFLFFYNFNQIDDYFFKDSVSQISAMDSASQTGGSAILDFQAENSFPGRFQVQSKSFR